MPGSDAWVDGADLEQEFFAAGRRDTLLERVARETGGGSFRPGEFERLLDELTYSREGVSVLEERQLWHAPALYLLLLAMMVAEWVVRRREGLS